MRAGPCQHSTATSVPQPLSEVLKEKGVPLGSSLLHLLGAWGVSRGQEGPGGALRAWVYAVHPGRAAEPPRGYHKCGGLGPVSEVAHQIYCKT